MKKIGVTTIGGMSMNRTFIQLFGFIIIVVITVGSVQNPFTATYLESLTKNEIVVSNSIQTLRSEVKVKASEFEVEPQDAKIDKVWKAMPGLNGLKVDIDASVKKMQQKGVFDENKLVFKEVPPSVTLKDLSPAPIYKGHPEKKMVSFVINVAWGNEYIPDMLQTLKDEGVSATFFLEGKWTKKNPELAKTIVDAGHEIGNHSYSHPDFKNLSAEATSKEIAEANSIIKAVTGKTPKWFGPPSGSFRDQRWRLLLRMI
jgi:probable sporulation protein (polysaccharide deacetylase family)